jgi:2-polyprenyl-3-methyl-5-hydroxy-6-metoxy-1,4-benzoquinol methylase
MPVHNRYSKYLSDQKQFFDELITEDWELYISDDWDDSRIFEIQLLLKKIRPASVLDIGCGCGFHDKVMAEFPFVKKVDGIDYSEQSIVKANEVYPHPKVNRIVADFMNFQPAGEYDLVVSFEVFEHLTDPDAYMDFCLKACAPKGFVAIITPNRLRLRNRILKMKKQPLDMEDVMHFREYSIKEMKTLGKKHGLDTYSVFGYGVLYYNHPLMKGLKPLQQVKLGAYYPPLANRMGVIYGPRK